MTAATQLLQALSELPTACAEAQTGFHFEEGGCWGMAYAIAEMAIEAGFHAEVKEHPFFIHATVLVDGKHYDHSGIVTMREVTEAGHFVLLSELRTVAGNYGISADQFEHDRAWARQIIENNIQNTQPT